MLVQCAGLCSEATSTAQYVTACRNPDHLVAAISSATGTAAVSNDVCVCGRRGASTHTNTHTTMIIAEAVYYNATNSTFQQ